MAGIPCHAGRKYDLVRWLLPGLLRRRQNRARRQPAAGAVGVCRKRGQTAPGAPMLSPAYRMAGEVGARLISVNTGNFADVCARLRRAQIGRRVFAGELSDARVCKCSARASLRAAACVAHGRFIQHRRGVGRHNSTRQMAASRRNVEAWLAPPADCFPRRRGYASCMHMACI